MTKKILAIVTTVFGVILGVVASLSGSTVETHAAYPVLTTGTIIELEPRSNYGSRITVSDSASQMSNNIQVNGSSLSKPQRYLVNCYDNGLELVPVCNSLMAVTCESTSNGSNVVATLKNGSLNQRFGFERQSNGSYVIRSKADYNAMLDINTNTGNLQVWASKTVKANNTFNVIIVSTPKTGYVVDTSSAGYINLNVREYPGAGYRKLGERSHGTIIDIDYAQNGWFHLSTGGFVSGSYVRTFEMPAMKLDIVTPVTVVSQAKSDGCGDASACSVINYLTGGYLSEASFRQKYTTSYHGYVFKIREGINHYLNGNYYKEVETTNRSGDEILRYLEKSLNANKPIIAHIKGNIQGAYTTSGHYIVVEGIRNEGQNVYILVADPFNGSASLGSGGTYRTLTLDEFLSLHNAGNHHLLVGSEVN